MNLKMNDNNHLMIKLTAYFTKKQIKQLKTVIEHLKKTPSENIINEPFFTQDYANLLYSIYNFFNDLSRPAFVCDKILSVINYKRIKIIIIANVNSLNKFISNLRKFINI